MPDAQTLLLGRVQVRAVDVLRDAVQDLLGAGWTLDGIHAEVIQAAVALDSDIENRALLAHLLQRDAGVGA